MDNLPPGDYTVYASDDDAGGMWWDPNFVKKYEGSGKPLHVTDGGKYTLDLKWTPTR
jgi:hypothetical protein